MTYVETTLRLDRNEKSLDKGSGFIEKSQILPRHMLIDYTASCYELKKDDNIISRSNQALTDKSWVIPNDRNYNIEIVFGGNNISTMPNFLHVCFTSNNI